MSPHQPDLPPAEQIPASPQKERVPGVLERLRLGRLATVCAGVEVAGGVASLLTGDPGFLEMGSLLNVVGVGFTVFDAHSVHVNNYSYENQPTRIFIKRKSELNKHA